MNKRDSFSCHCGLIRFYNDLMISKQVLRVCANQYSALTHIFRTLH